MTEPPTTAAYLDVAAEAVRGYNYESAHDDAYDHPGEVSDAYASLAALAEQLAQAIQQTAGWVAQEVGRGGVVVDAGDFAGAPADAATAVEHHSGQAASSLRNAEQELRAAWRVVDAMTSAHGRGGDEGSTPRS